MSEKRTLAGRIGKGIEGAMVSSQSAQFNKAEERAQQTSLKPVSQVPATRKVITFPQEDLDLLAAEVGKCRDLGINITQSQIVRYGVILFSQLDEEGKRQVDEIAPRQPYGPKK